MELQKVEDVIIYTGFNFKPLHTQHLEISKTLKENTPAYLLCDMFKTAEANKNIITFVINLYRILRASIVLLGANERIL